MQDKITSIIGHMSVSHIQMARILESKRYMAFHCASFIHAIPDDDTTFVGAAAITGQSLKIGKSVAAYMSSLADLQDAIADNLSEVMKELNGDSEE